ncbi:hypothetical protein AMTR_s00041p00218340 [Amborella trichopoda]|uniref:Uncharacterized protein n=1 Tax=Amborella trichopoda TaxID=13333 RepID=W1PYS6_AMBTC|nr:hypothetical protein AMTR_s00041p00218340 [Amborella trichopoda]
MCPFTKALLPQNDNTRPPQPPDHARISRHHRTEPSNASDPAVVLSWSRVAMLPFNSTGIPCNPLAHSPCVASLSLSALSAWSNASGFTSSIARRSRLSALISQR